MLQSADVDKKQKEQTFFIKVLVSDLDGLAARARDQAARDKLQSLSETARYSDPVSHEALSGLESEISAKVRALSPLVADGDVSALCDEITLLLGDRNAKC